MHLRLHSTLYTIVLPVISGVNVTKQIQTLYVAVVRRCSTYYFLNN